jgi:DNA-binding transcriptional LysR family regulator
MDLRDLSSYVAVADELHFGRAAERLHLTQPAVSQRVRRLERELSTQLLVRTSRSVSLTESGRLVRRWAEQILRDVERLREDVDDLREGRTGLVRVGFVGTATYDLLPRLSRLVEQRLPGVQLQLVGEQLTPELLDAMEAGDLDLAVVRDAPASASLSRTFLRSEELVAALPSDHPAADGAYVRLSDLRDERFIVHPASPPSAMHANVLAACRSAGFTPRDTIEVRETSTLVTSVAAGLGVALVPGPVRSLQLEGVAYRTAVAGQEMTTELSLLAQPDASTASGAVAALLSELTSG